MEIHEMRSLLECAKKARKNAYSPYSGFSVGAALITKNGKIYTGCNIENASYTPTCCAERVAVFSAVSEGCRDFAAIAVAGNTVPCMPCGVCRQVLSEFCDDEMLIIYEGENREPEYTTLGELLPMSFSLKEK